MSGVSLDRLRLKAGEDVVGEDDGNIEDLHVYESSLHTEAGEPLVSLILTSSRTGIRLTPTQVTDLYGWLGEWLGSDDASSSPPETDRQT